MKQVADCRIFLTLWDCESRGVALESASIDCAVTFLYPTDWFHCRDAGLSFSAGANRRTPKATAVGAAFVLPVPELVSYLCGWPA